jgi:uncharacterized membrane protein HdeD (DUF308 family)
MATLDRNEARALEAERSPAPWWLFLVTGIAWLLLALVVLRFDITSVAAVGVMLGVLFAVATVTEILAAVSAPAWRWAHWILVAVFAIGSLWAFVHPIGAFWELASVLGFLLVLKGSFDIIGSVVAKAVNDLWWLGLVAGIIEVLLAFWVSQQYFAPRAALIIVWAGFMAILRGIGDIALAFGIRRVEHAAV